MRGAGRSSRENPHYLLLSGETERVLMRVCIEEYKEREEREERRIVVLCGCGVGVGV